MEFAGSLVLTDNDSLPATLRVDGEFLAIDFAAGQVGRWPLATCHVAKDGDAFRMTIGDEVGRFEPLDPNPMGDWVDTRWPPFVGDSATTSIASEEVEQESPTGNPNPKLSLARVAGLGVAIVLGAIVITALIARDRPSPNLLASIPTVSTVPSTPTLFTGGVDQVTFAWNEASDQLGIDLFLLEAPGPNRLQMNLREGLTLYATEDPATGFVRSLMIAAAPTFSEEQGEAVLAAWGTLIATVTPELDGEGRRRLLRDLGVDPNRPVPNGIRSEVVSGGAAYILRSGVLGGRALLTATPAS